MSADQMPEQPPAPQGPPPESLERTMEACLRAARTAAEDSAGVQDARETKELGAAALSFAQAFTVLDPSRLQGGDTPEARRASTPPQTPTGRDGDRDGQVGER